MQRLSPVPFLEGMILFGGDFYGISYWSYEDAIKAMLNLN